MSARARWSGDRSGATLALVAVFMLVLLASAALAVDMAMAFASHAEAQRVADASSLAGASSFLEYDADDPLAEDTARARAYDYALKNRIRGEDVDSAEVTVQVITDSMKVRVWVHREGLSTWFAKIFGINEMDVAAKAAAKASNAGETRCLKPFAIPDAWGEPVGGDDDNPYNHVWDDTESWDYGNQGGDWYARYETDAESGTTTGYGSDYRSDYDRDQGRQLALKLGDPQSSFSIAPGLFFPFRLPTDPDQAQCQQGGGGGGEQGGAVYRQNICTCNTNSIQIGDSLEVEPGNMIGPTKQGIGELVDQDPNAVWDEDLKRVVNSDWGDNWLGSPRVVKIALMDPTTMDKGGMQYVKFNNFGLFFIEDMPSGGKNKDDLMGRFIKFATGGGEGETSGSLVLYLRLVE